MQEIDIWRAAQALIENYGAEAELTACQRADRAIDQGDPEGERVWKAVLAAVKDLQWLKPRASEPLN